MTPLQQRAAVATGGTQADASVYRDPAIQNYYRNLALYSLTEKVGRPLPERHNIVITRDPNYVAEGCDVVSSIGEALELTGDADEVMVIGGGQVYRDFMPHADRIYMTRVQAEVQGDTLFPGIDGNTWRLVSSEHHAADDKHEYAFEVAVFERRRA